MMKLNFRSWAAALIIMVAAVVLVSNAYAYVPCEACIAKASANSANQDWSASADAFLTGNTTQQELPSSANPVSSRMSNAAYNAMNTADSGGSSANKSSNNGKTIESSQSANTKQSSQPSAPQRSSKISSMLVPVGSLSNFDVILDISPNASEYIDGAINIPYTDFVKEGGALKPVSEIAKVLGDAGISRTDRVAIYGECLPCGGGPSAATFAYYVLKYLGHDNVKLLDGGINDWVAAELPTESNPRNGPATSYVPELRSDLMATYDLVKNGGVQVVDARTSQEYDAGNIPGSKNIPYDSILSNGKIKDEASLNSLFSGLAKTKPVVVYTNTGVKASMVWFALEMLGYDARLYTWQDWVKNQPTINIDLKENPKAEPNPANMGSPVKITVVFSGQGNQTVSVPSPAAAANNSTILTTKGCSTCGFGSAESYADLNTSSGVIQIGNTAKLPSAEPSPVSSSGLKSVAVIRDSAGALVSRVNLLRVSDDTYSGIWNANVAVGTYEVSIEASTTEATKTFNNVLEIQITAATSKYKNNLGNY